MRKWTTTKVTVEGHCDSRGTAEYNLALGERRATAVKDYLVSLGVGANRILTVSKGKEAPFCTGRERVLLVAEPARPLHHYREVGASRRKAGRAEARALPGPCFRLC